MPDLLLSFPTSQLGARISSELGTTYFTVVEAATVKAWAAADKAAVIASYQADPAFAGWQVMNSADDTRRVLYTNDIGAGINASAYGAIGDGASHPLSAAAAALYVSLYGVAAVAGDETDWAAIQAAVFAVGQASIAAGTIANAYRKGGVVNVGRGVFVMNKTLQMAFGVTLRGQGRTSFHIDTSGTYPTGTILKYTGAAAAAAVNMTGFVAATGLPVAYNVAVTGADMDAFTYSICENCRLENLTIYTAVVGVTYGINFTGNATSGLENVAVNGGFTTGIRVRATWGSTLSNIHVAALLVALSIESDTNGCSFDNCYLTAVTATANSICIQTSYARACNFSRVVCEHAVYGMYLDNCYGGSFNGIYFEDISTECVHAISVFGATFTGVWVNCALANVFVLLNTSAITVTSVSLFNALAMVGSIAATATITIISGIPTAGEKTKDFGAGRIQYVNSPDLKDYSMAVGRIVNVDMPTAGSQVVERYAVNGTAQWQKQHGPTYEYWRDQINARYAFQFEIATTTFWIRGLQVLGQRVTGYTNAWAGSVDRATAFNTGTVTLAQLAARVNALQTDLVAHGVIGV